jgi:excisionase family DNA binding protein
MTPAAMKVPSTKDAEQAQVAVRALSGLLRKKSPRTIRVQPEGAKEQITVTVPTEAFELFLDILAQMANGNAVSIVPVHAELTTQQAADLLNVSRPFLVGLLDDGKIPFRTVGTHRRVMVADLLAYKERDAAHRNKVADELAAEAQKLGLGY